MQKSNFNLTSLVVIVVLLGLLSLALFPCISSSMYKANMSAVAARGRDIYVAITSANTDREPFDLPSVWPQSNPPTNNAVDISQINFTNSTDYFWALYDGDHLGTTNHNPYVRGFDFSKLAGPGVAAHSGQGRLNPKNNMWTIAKNVREEMEDIVPVLVTRNLAAESLAVDIKSVSDRRLFFDEEWMTPFGRKGFVIVRKGGGTYNFQARYMTHRVLYNSQTFMTTIPGSQRLGLRYLTPNKEVIPSEAVYQACATSDANPWKRYRYWMRDQLEHGLEILLYCFSIMGLISGIFLFLKGAADKKLSALMSVAGLPYWLALWLAITLYMCCPVMLVVENSGSIPLPLVLALVFQMVGCLYMVVWKRRTGNHEAFRTALHFMLAAPLIALRCLAIAVLFALILSVFYTVFLP
jgi:type II secretory pathway pseudopilin PulG